MARRARFAYVIFCPQQVWCTCFTPFWRLLHLHCQHENGVMLPIFTGVLVRLLRVLLVLQFMVAPFSLASLPQLQACTSYHFR